MDTFSNMNDILKMVKKMYVYEFHDVYDCCSSLKPYKINLLCMGCKLKIILHHFAMKMILFKIFAKDEIKFVLLGSSK